MEKIRLNAELKLILGFIIFYLVSGTIPGIVSLFISVLKADTEVANFLIPFMTISVSLIICVFVGMYLIKWIAQPITHLNSAMESMLEGNMDIDTVVDTGDEIESFSHSLSRMKSSLMIATELLGPQDYEIYQSPKKIKGLSVGEKIVFALLVFLIFNPIVAYIPIALSLDVLLGASLASLLFSVIMALFLASFLHNSIMEPFIALTEAADKISRGDFSTEIGTVSTGDIGRLEYNFKMISDRVEKAVKEMENE